MAYNVCRGGTDVESLVHDSPVKERTRSALNLHSFDRRRNYGTIRLKRVGHLDRRSNRRMIGR